MCFFDCIPLLGGVFVAMSAFWCSYKVFFGSVSRKQLIAKLQGKVVCVTGASSGIGKEIAKLCFDCGAKVILVARRKELLETLKEEMMESLESSDKRKEDIAIVTADLGKLDTVESTGNEILNCFGVVHGLVNNAGIGCRGSVQSTLIDVHQNVMNLNYFSQIVLVKTLLPSMMACNERCWIVATSSLQGKIALPFRSGYAASKHACQAFYDSLRAEIEWRSNISVCLLSPGYVRTDISLNSATGSGESYGKLDKTIARGMSPVECARRSVEAFATDQKDVCIAPWYHCLIPYGRMLLPSVYFHAMKKKAVRDMELYA
ncbi:dehydrogenase/reductase SDR family protein 7-like [Convolutriloba macropyga]|uniref:dehydrogenase/reductase SDR family protein 7-like n=1 Tax=Convolutriloba macropyga TaxID=536237 RepID=UPI003F5205BD